MSSSRLSAIVAWFCAWPGRFADRHPAPPNLRGQRLTLVPMVLVVSTSCMLACIGLRVAQPDPGDKEIMVETTRNIWQLAFPSSLLSFILSIYLTLLVRGALVRRLLHLSLPTWRLLGDGYELLPDNSRSHPLVPRPRIAAAGREDGMRAGWHHLHESNTDQIDLGRTTASEA
ncbi:hypothetical protein KJ359_008581 [Pestalotiopsis sp. 9143b]|nr:hypothetical protein KJ359_008581 [Pestalotiopsis sp. 9143b]